MPDPWWETLLKLLVATLCAGAIGWEREAKNRPAGLRTNILVALGACAFTLEGLALHRGSDPAALVDPIRVIAGVVGGVGFLGAGAILHSRGEVRGLTTAAGVWVVAAIGVASACGDYVAVALVTTLTLLTLSLMAKLGIEAGAEDRGAGHEGGAVPPPPTSGQL